MPAGYASQTGYQYDSISRVAGQRDPAPPSKFSKEGGFKNSVFKGISESLSYHSKAQKLWLQVSRVSPASKCRLCRFLASLRLMQGSCMYKLFALNRRFDAANRAKDPPARAAHRGAETRTGRLRNQIRPSLVYLIE